MNRIMVSLSVVLLLASGPAALANILTSMTVDDPVGDVDAKVYAPYYDMRDCGVDLGVDQDGLYYTFRQRMAETIPAVPVLPTGGTKYAFWSWGIGTDPNSDPQGYPVANGHTQPHEFYAGLIWMDGAYSAFMIDRRPISTGGEAITFPIPFEVAGDEVRVFVRAEQLDNPAGFYWRSGVIFPDSRNLGTSGFKLSDVCAFPYTLFSQ